jgi:hypothetical protein
MCKLLKSFLPIFLLSMLSLLIGCGGDDGTSPTPDTRAEWTILSYGAGNNNLDNAEGGYSYCVEDVQEYQKIGSTDKVHVVAMVASLKTGGNAKYYHIQKYPDDIGDNISSEVLEDIGGKDMSDPQTLKDFLVYGMNKYPAKKYMVIIDDHGAGWPGSCVDEQHGSGNMLSMVDMAGALKNVITQTKISKFEIVAFHCCLMSMVEVAYQLKSCANYMVASEFVLPMESVFGSYEWLGYLTTNPTTGGEEMAKKIVTAVYNAGQSKQKDTHMAATDLSKMDRLVAKVDNLGTQLRTTATEYWWEVYNAWGNCWNTQLDHQAYIDLRDFANNLKQQTNLQNINLVKNAADSVISAINEAVIITKTNVSDVTRGGLTIHMPYLMEMYDSTNYAKLDFQAVPWTSFLSYYIHGLEPYLYHELTVTVSPSGCGSVTKYPNKTEYDYGETVTLTAVAASGYAFDHWSGSASGSTNPVQITMDDDKSVTANFVTQSSGQTVTITGTISWSGHSLTYPYAFLDTSHTSAAYGIHVTAANTSTGAFTIQFDLSSNLEAYIAAIDNLNNDQYIDSNEPIGWWDVNSDGYINSSDMLTIQPGQTINNVTIYLQIPSTQFMEKIPLPIK